MPIQNDVCVKIKYLVSELRNGRNSEVNYSEFDKLVKGNLKTILIESDLKWLVSICDTYADYGNSEEKRNALYVSYLSAMTRLADTFIQAHELSVREETLSTLKHRRNMLYDGSKTLNIDRQDTFLNLSKRTYKNMEKTPHIYEVYLEVCRRLKRNSSIWNFFINNSARSVYFLPENPFTHSDNYGIF